MKHFPAVVWTVFLALLSIPAGVYAGPGTAAGAVWSIPASPYELTGGRQHPLLPDPRASMAVSLNRTAWLGGTSYNTIGFQKRIGRRWTVGTTLGYLSVPDVDNVADESPVEYGTQTASLMLNYRATGFLTLCANADYLHETFTGLSTGTDLARHWVTAGAGLRVDLPAGFSATGGVDQQGFGSRLSDSEGAQSDVPLRFMYGGIAWARGPLALDAETRYADGMADFRVGTRLMLGEHITLRGAYHRYGSANALGALTGGVDLLLRKGIAVSWAWQPSDVGNIHALGIRWQLHHQMRHSHLTDRELAESALAEGLSEALADLPRNGAPIVIRAQNTTDRQVQRVLITILLNSGLEVNEAPTSGNPCLVYEVIQKELIVFDRGSYLLGTDRTERVFRADILMRLVSSDGRPVWVKPVGIFVTDTIPGNLSTELTHSAVIPRHTVNERHPIVETLLGSSILAAFLLLAF